MAALRTDLGGTDLAAPGRRGPARYLWWLVVSQRQRIAGGALLGSLWMIGLAVPPYVLSRAIDDGLRPGDFGQLAVWTAVLGAVGILNAWLAVMRHRTMSRVRLDAYVRTVRLVVDHTTRLGATLPRRLSAGEVVAIGHSDVGILSQTLTVMGPGIGGVLSYLVVAALLLSVSVLLAVIVLLGVPLLALAIGPLLGRLTGAEGAYRDQQGRLAAVFGDLSGGLRVLNGLGGKEVFAARYRDGSRRLRDEGYRVGAALSWIQALALGLPTLFLAAVTWLSARMAAQGDLTVGELVAVYGYVAVLVVPVNALIEGGYDISRGLVAARRVVGFLDLEPETSDTELTSHSVPTSNPSPAPGEPSVLRDPTSGVEVAPGTLTALVSAHPADSTAIIDRLGRFAPTDATWGSTRLDSIPLPDVRARILVADNEAHLFSGTLREVIAGRGAKQPGPQDDGSGRETCAGQRGDDAGAPRPDGGTAEPTWPGAHTAAPAELGTHIERPASPDADITESGHPRTDHHRDASLAPAIDAALARDIVQALPHGLDSALTPEGRNLSGGQRQRIRLARALHADPEVLLAPEPTSAVDAHTEATIATRLRTARAGRTTVVTTTSPLLLDQADTVHYLVDGKVHATGTHPQLLATQPGYRRLVTRGADDSPTPPPSPGTAPSESAPVPSTSTPRQATR
ncbi:ABC transporter transmembrane domain-containing protein [Streptomyces lasiicapitis]|uniref:ABC transporter n=1 Tax=Streptomyces lasiicapitis TaxID=1923961 RepID=A0ABQ2MC29_9ACTN|nr:ABC transporter ATP-binding protein [Streptomyces lasiicapitis]GGO48453.1 ABC transporter [Streptomyces lasiicapitis]